MPSPRKGSSAKSQPVTAEATKTEATKSQTDKSQADKSQADKSQAVESQPPADQPAAAVPAETDASAEVAEDAVPLNRAERRAKGKTHGQVQMTGRGKVTRSTGPAAGPRMWANRRSG
jgi:hypothetical protein